MLGIFVKNGAMVSCEKVAGDGNQPAREHETLTFHHSHFSILCAAAAHLAERLREVSSFSTHALSSTLCQFSTSINRVWRPTVAEGAAGS